MTFPSPNDGDLPLAGVRVLDLSRVLAGPLCTQYLGDLGAEVIKVEAPTVGDETRGWPPYRNGEGAIFLSLNRNKRSIALDLKTPEGQAIVKRLAARSDVVIENFGDLVSARLGVSYEDLKPCNPKMVYCAISGFGRSGPLKDVPAYDFVLQAFSGLMSLTGEPGGAPVRSPISPIDQTTGMHAMAGVLAALLRAERTGKGAFIEVSLFDTAVGVLAFQLQTFWETGKQPVKNGSRHLSLCPYQVFEASDGPFLLAITNDRQWARFCAVAGREELAQDSRYAANPQRVARYAETAALVQEIIGADTGESWLARLTPAEVPCSPLNDLASLMRHPHTLARDILVDYDRPDLGPTRAVALPIIVDGRERTAGTAPPRHGEHTDQILAEIGYSEHEIAALHRDRLVVGSR